MKDFTNIVIGINNGDEMLSMKARLFGHMVQLVQPILQHYQSDLYHDALAVEKMNWQGNFYYLANATGTCLMFTDEWIHNPSHREHVWLFELNKEPSYGDSFKFTCCITKVRG